MWEQQRKRALEGEKTQSKAKSASSPHEALISQRQKARDRNQNVRPSPHTQHKNTRQARGCTNRQYEEHWNGKRARFSTMSPSSPTTTPLYELPAYHAHDALGEMRALFILSLFRLIRRSTGAPAGQPNPCPTTHTLSSSLSKALPLPLPLLPPLLSNEGFILSRFNAADQSTLILLFLPSPSTTHTHTEGQPAAPAGRGREGERDKEGEESSSRRLMKMASSSFY
jgi:hypothetical protein